MTAWELRKLSQELEHSSSSFWGAERYFLHYGKTTTTKHWKPANKTEHWITFAILPEDKMGSDNLWMMVGTLPDALLADTTENWLSTKSYVQMTHIYFPDVVRYSGQKKQWYSKTIPVIYWRTNSFNSCINSEHSTACFCTDTDKQNMEICNNLQKIVYSASV